MEVDSAVDTCFYSAPARAGAGSDRAAGPREGLRDAVLAECRRSIDLAVGRAIGALNRGSFEDMRRFVLSATVSPDLWPVEEPELPVGVVYTGARPRRARPCSHRGTGA